MACSLLVIVVAACVLAPLASAEASFHLQDKVPFVYVPLCDKADPVRIGNYSLSDGSGPANQRTDVFLCHTGDSLKVREVAIDNNVFSNATTCGDNVWTNDAMEMMLAPGLSSPINYTEIDLSPNSVMWAGRIHNPTGLRPQNTTMLNCTCGIDFSAGRTADGWEATLTVPFALLMPPGSVEPPPLVWRINFFRTDMARGQDELEYSCWSPTYHTPPDFHIPRYFGVMILE